MAQLRHDDCAFLLGGAGCVSNNLTKKNWLTSKISRWINFLQSSYKWILQSVWCVKINIFHLRSNLLVSPHPQVACNKKLGWFDKQVKILPKGQGNTKSSWNWKMSTRWSLGKKTHNDISNHHKIVPCRRLQKRLRGAKNGVAKWERKFWWLRKHYQYGFFAICSKILPFPGGLGFANLLLGNRSISLLFVWFLDGRTFSIVFSRQDQNTLYEQWLVDSTYL